MLSLLPELHDRLDWPEPDHILNPPGDGPAVYLRLARQKIEAPLARLLGKDQVRVGILAGDPSTTNSDPPIALVCLFTVALSSENLNRTRNLAWNFCRTPLLITLEPQLIRVWSCFEMPDEQTGQFPEDPVAESLEGPSLDLGTLTETLNWAQLASGQFFAYYPDRFDAKQRVDHLLLKNLRYLRQRLTEDQDAKLPGLEETVAHDLLARVVFLQFLIDRTDARGKAALDECKLQDLAAKGILAQNHDCLASLLRNKTDLFALFRWLNRDHFNGDLFPRDYADEERQVKQHHLETLADFVSGTLEMEKGQYLLWRYYSFDTIPLEFISSIYEEFVTKPKGWRKGEHDGEKKDKDGDGGIGEHYTRPFLVDFVLDKVLPWGGTEYDLKILDPCCGSAVFLVKAFQRLVHRWRRANPKLDPPVSVLRGFLENNLFGVDVAPNAIHVASFSLYLAMCDEIDPKHYWSQIHFPPLRGKRICQADFFAEDTVGVRTQEDSGRYDLVVGNAPWGKDSLSEDARKWAKNPDNGPWPTANEQVGTLFLAKATKLCKPGGRVCMIQSASALLFNVSKTATSFRKKMFSEYKVDEVVNLSALRFLNIFPRAVGPACIVNMRPIPPDGEAIAYWSPKQGDTVENTVRVVVDEQDLSWVWPEEAAEDPVVWAALTWGGRRDLEFIRRLRLLTSVADLSPQTPRWHAERGFERCRKGRRTHSNLLGLPVLENHRLWQEAPLVGDSSFFPSNTNGEFYRTKDMSVYELPLVIMPKSWTVQTGRFRAIAVKPDKHTHLLFSQSFVGVRAPTEEDLATFALCANSRFAVYYLYNASGRLASYRPSYREVEIREFPLPTLRPISLDSLSKMSPQEIDSTAAHLYGLNEVEVALVEDFTAVAPEDSRAQVEEPRRQSGANVEEGTSNIAEYAEWFLRVFRSAFGSDKPACATVFRTSGQVSAPFCMVGIHLDWERSDLVRYQDVSDGDLLGTVRQCVCPEQASFEGFFYRRVSRIYLGMSVTEEGKLRTVPTVFLIKPNRIRYWTRSAAIRDADSVVADLMQAGERNGIT